MAKDDSTLKAALCYLPVVGLVVSIVFLVLESENREIKWHALQSIFFMVAATVVSFAVGMTGVLGFLVPLLNIAAFVIELVLLVRTYQGHKLALPIISEWVDKLLK